MNIHEAKNIIFGIPNSIMFNYKAFGIRGIFKLYILISKNTHFKKIKRGSIIIPRDCKMGSIKIGINLGPYNRGIGKHTHIYINNGKIYFFGKTNIATDSVINVNNGEVFFGNNFCANNGFLCSCENKIEFGNDVLIGWNCTIIDGDGHNIINLENNKKINNSKPIIIGNHVWFGANCVITKGTYIADNVAVGEGTLINKKIENSFSLFAGRPAKMIKTNINWER